MKPPCLSHVQAGVQIVQNMVQCGMAPEDYRRESELLHKLMAEYAFGQIREQYIPMYEDCTEAQASQTFEQWVLDEESENEPYALAYWAATSAFFRKVYQAAAAAA